MVALLPSWPHRLAWPRTSDFHSGNRGSNPLGVISKKKYGSLAQRLEHLTFNERVEGSNPSRPISFFFLSKTFLSFVFSVIAESTSL